MRKACLDAVYEMALRDTRVVFIGSDLGAGTLDNFRRNLPDRFFMEGVSEAAIVGMMAGLAMSGRIPYMNTIAPFIVRRACEQVALDACLHRFPLRFLASGGGVVYAPLGPTHLAVEDIALMRALPNMTVIAPADAEEMRRLMPLTLDYPGPIYIRLAKGGDPIVTTAAGDFEIGRAIPMRQGRDALIVTTGVLLKSALESAQVLSQQGIEAGVLHVPTVKPFDTETMLDMARHVRVVVTAEEHSIIGGLGSAVAEVLAEAAFDRPPRLARLGFPDVFPDHYGSQAEHLAHYGLTSEGIRSAVLRLLDVVRPPHRETTPR